VVTADIGQPGAVSRFTFTATAGQKVFVDVPTATLPDQCGVVVLDGPDGKELGSGCVINGDGYVDGTVLPDSGTYTVLVDPKDRVVGQATLRLVSDHDQTAATSVGGSPTTVTIGQPGAVWQITFQGAAGQKLSVLATASTLPDQCGLLELDGPDGKEVASGCVVDGTGGITAATLPSTGQYTVLVRAHGRHTGSLVLRVVTAS
jgi:hypothetical protein